MIDVEKLVEALGLVDADIVEADPSTAVELGSDEAGRGRRDYAQALAAKYEQLHVAHPGEPHEFECRCTRCGDPGVLNVTLVGPDEQVRIEPRP